MKKIDRLSWLIATILYILLISIDQSSASNREIKEELRFIHQEIGILQDENHHQNIEIAFLKEKTSTKDFDDHRHQMLENPLLPYNNYRSKRPVRLLPPHILYGEQENETEEQKQNNRRRFQQPTNCSDLSILGYTLNGFYLVKSNESINNSISTNNEIQLETVYCTFKQPKGAFKPAVIEKRIISRRETKTSSQIIFHATKSTKVEFKGFDKNKITLFDKVLVNVEGSFNKKTGMFTVPKTGVYLLVFRGEITFQQVNSNREFSIGFFRNDGFTWASIRKDKNKWNNADSDKLFKGKKGDIIEIVFRFFENGNMTLSANSTFFAYLFESNVSLWKGFS